MTKKLKYLFYEKMILPFKLWNKTKFFCIGMNKTGTTSLKQAFEDLRFIVGNQRNAENLLPEYIKKNFDPIIKYCRTAQVFQDIPFSLPNTYEKLDEIFPSSKYILTVRDSPEQWYNSITKFHAKLFGEGSIPSIHQLQAADYAYPSFMWAAQKAICNPPCDDPYNKKVLIESYKQYNAKVKTYFKDRLNDLLVINLSEKGSYQKLIKFLGITSPFDDFPWENRTSELVIK